MNRIFNRKSAICLAVIIVLVCGGGYYLKAHSQPKPKRIFLSAEQLTMLNQIDAAMKQLEAQYKDLANQKGGIVNGFAASMKELGPDWMKKFKYATAEDGRPCFEEIIADGNGNPSTVPQAGEAPK